MSDLEDITRDVEVEVEVEADSRMCTVGAYSAGVVGSDAAADDADAMGEEAAEEDTGDGVEAMSIELDDSSAIRSTEEDEEEVEEEEDDNELVGDVNADADTAELE
jgi:hypothetical protein